MAIYVNGAALRNMPEQISKNVEDIAELQDDATALEGRVSDLENKVISSITFNNMSTTGDTVLGDGAGDSTTIHGTLQQTDGNAEFGGNVEIDGTLTVNSAVDLNNDLDVAGDASVSGALSATGNAAVGGNLSVTGDAQIFENITDASGHKRFIEGEPTNAVIPGVTFTYKRWSLSGTHLMLVIAGTIDNGTDISGSPTLAVYNVPQWVINKITTIFSSFVIRSTATLYASDYTTQTVGVSLLLTGGNTLSSVIGDITLDKDRIFRIQFDLLIDNQ